MSPRLLPLALLVGCSPGFHAKDSDAGPVADSTLDSSDSVADSDSTGDTDTGRPDTDTGHPDTDTGHPDDTDTADTGPDTSGPDADGDGYPDADDCAPTDPSVHPNAPEVWYDGLDSDCEGDDDFDQDHDGVEAAGLGGTDCNDLDGSIYTGATDIWYDGIDSDCGGQDDYDQDADGHDDPSGGGDDCDDTDATVNPEALEVLDDAKDGDCNGSDDGPAFVTLETYTGSGVQGPRIAETSDAVLITVLADSFVDGATVYTTGAITSALDVRDTLGGVTSTLFSEWGTGWSWDTGLDFAADDDHWVWAYGIHDGSTTRYLAGESYVVATNLSGATGISRTTSQTFDDVEMAENTDGSFEIVGCDTGGGVLAWMHGNEDELYLGGGVTTDDTSGYGSDACLPYTTDEQLRVGKRGSSTMALVDYSDATGLSDAGSQSGWSIYDMEGGLLESHEIFVASEGASGVYVEDNGASTTLAVADADQVDVDSAGGVLYIAVTDGSRTAWLYWGSVGPGFSSVELDTALARVDDIAVHVTAGGEAVIAARGSNDVTYAVVSVP